MANRPPRLEFVYGSGRAALWFVTFNTHQRQKLLCTRAVHERFKSFYRKAENFQIDVGCYVLMPDHAHLFVTGGHEFDSSKWVRLLKLSLSPVIDQPMPHWQEGFFDHLLRCGRSYDDKWEYVCQNPVRAGLVGSPEEWVFQGEINRLPFNRWISRTQ